MLELDHFAVSGETLAEARERVEDALGVPMQPGGQHAVFHTHNALLGLDDGLYLEAIAIDPAAPKPDRPRWFDLDRFSGQPRLTNWICRTQELEDFLAKTPLALGQPVDLERGALRWQMAVPENGALPFDNCAPAVMEWKTTDHPTTRLTRHGISLRSLTIWHPQAGLLSDVLQPLLANPRIFFDTGSPALRAEFDTPHGMREMSSLKPGA